MLLNSMRQAVLHDVLRTAARRFRWCAARRIWSRTALYGTGDWMSTF